jgi:hypothetical protein
MNSMNPEKATKCYKSFKQLTNRRGKEVLKNEILYFCVSNFFSLLYFSNQRLNVVFSHMGPIKSKIFPLVNCNKMPRLVIILKSPSIYFENEEITRKKYELIKSQEFTDKSRSHYF